MNKSIKIDEVDYKKLLNLADANGRTIKGQIHVILANIEFLPRPADATPVPVVYIPHPEELRRE